jgi:NlpC/P60 family putative phage cell wall peptidase
MDWAERSGEERLYAAAERHCGPQIGRVDMQWGDLILFRWRAGYAAKHAGILSSERRFIHAYEQAGVIESALVPSWERRIAAVFRFPPLA